MSRLMQLVVLCLLPATALAAPVVGSGMAATQTRVATGFHGVALAIPAGIGYGWLLNRTRGQEMMVGTYLGFAIVSGMSIFWLLAPFTNPTLSKITPWQARVRCGNRRCSIGLYFEQ